MEFYEKHAAERSRFEIVALHDGSAKSFDELDKKLAERDVVNKRWNGKNLPFPVVLDKDGKTTTAYGISAFPTILLIDPQGNLVRDGSEEMLEQKLKEPAEEDF